MVDIWEPRSLHSPDNTVPCVDSFKHLLKKQNVRSSQIEQLKMVKQYKQLVTSSIQLLEGRSCPTPHSAWASSAFAEPAATYTALQSSAGETNVYKINNLRLNKLK